MAILNSVRLFVLKLKHKIVDFFFETPTLLFVITIPLWMIGMYFINKIYGIEWKDIWSNADGVVFDLVIFGALFSFYEWIRSKRERIKHYEEEIDDYRGWDEKEATYRIVGLIRRLKREGVSHIKLNNCYLTNALLPNVDLSGVDLSEANLSGANLKGANLSGANLSKANLTGADLTGAKLVSANLKRAQLLDTKLSKADLSGADLTNALLSDFNYYEPDPAPYEPEDDPYDQYNEEDWERLHFFQQSSNCHVADLSGAKLIGSNFTGANLNYVDLHNADLTKAIMYRAELINAWLSKANLLGANFTEANLTRTYLEDALAIDNWIEKIEKHNVIGCNEIKEQYKMEKINGQTTLKKK